MSDPQGGQSDDESITVLCVDDEPGMAALMAICLQRIEDRFETRTATSATDGLQILSETEIDCVVSDYRMRGINGLVFLEIVRAKYPDTPFILFTSHGSENIASKAISAGVTDYMEKSTGMSQYELLARRVENAVFRSRGNTSEETAQQRTRRVLDTSPDPILISSEGRCLYANAAAAELFGRERDSLQGAQLTALLDTTGEQVERVEQDRGQLHGVRDRLYTDGDETEVTVTAWRIDWAKETGAIVVCRPAATSETDELEKDALLRRAFDSAPHGALILGVSGEVLAYNEQFLDLWNIDYETPAIEAVDLLPSVVSAAVADTAAASELFDSWLHTQKHETAVLELDSGRQIELQIVPLTDADDEPLGSVWYARELDKPEIDGDRSARESPAETLARVTDAVVAVDTEWRVTAANEQATTLFGVDRTTLLGESLWASVPSLAGTEFEQECQRALQAQAPISGTVSLSDTETIHLRCFPSSTGVTIWIEETDVAGKEGKLAETVRQLETIYQIASDQELSFEAKREQILTVGSEYLDLPYGFVSKITEAEQEIVAAVGSHDLLQPGSTCPLEQSYCRQTVSTPGGFLAIANAVEIGWEGELPYETFELGTYIGAKLLVDGELYGTLCFAATTPRDQEFTETERMVVELMARWLSYEYDNREHQRQVEAKNERLDRFASMVSHDLRNPLDVAMTRRELAAAECDSEHLDHIERAHERIQALIEDILLLTRHGDAAEDVTDLDLAAVARWAWDGVSTPDATLVTDGDRMISADKSRLTQLFENLFRNAIEHAGESVTVTVGPLEDGFYVEDDGPGIPDEQRERVFEEGFSGREGGTGLGLNIVQTIAASHGWEVTISESADGGARFEIREGG